MNIVSPDLISKHNIWQLGGLKFSKFNFTSNGSATPILNRSEYLIPRMASEIIQHGPRLNILGNTHPIIELTEIFHDFDTIRMVS